MTEKTKVLVVLQGSAFLIGWPIWVYLSATANHPPAYILVIVTMISVALGVMSLVTFVYRDRVADDPVRKSLISSIQGFCVTVSISVIPLVGGSYQFFRANPKGGGNEIYLIAAVLLVQVGFAFIVLWRLYRWRRYRSIMV